MGLNGIDIYSLNLPITGRTGPGSLTRTHVQSANALRMTTASGLHRQGRSPRICAEIALNHARRAPARARHPPFIRAPGRGQGYSERCCGMPASRARTSVSR